MTNLIVELGQRVTGHNLRPTQDGAIASHADAVREADSAIAFADQGAARSPLTADGMAAYAGIMATFTGTSGGDMANATSGQFTGFTGGTGAQLQDSSADTFNAGGGNDTIIAGSGGDSIDGGSGDDSISGGNGNDIIIGDTGTDSIDGGAGNDQIYIGNSEFVLGEAIDGGANTDTILLTTAAGTPSTSVQARSPASRRSPAATRATQ